MTVTYPIVRFIFADNVTLEFSKEQIVRAALVDEINGVSIEMPISELDLKLAVTDDSFSMFSGSSYTMLTERLPMLVYESVDASVRLLGKFYLDTWKNTAERNMEFKAKDIIGVLEDTDFDGAFWENATTLTTILDQILSPINVSYELDASLVAVTLKGWIPAGTYRNALQQICFAAGAIATASGRETLLISPISLPSLLPDATLGSEDKIRKSEIELLPLISRIELMAHNYIQGLVAETIFDKYLEIGNYKIVFDQPYTGIAVVGSGYTQFVLGTEGGDYIATEFGDYIEAGGEFNAGSNSLYLTVAVAGQVTITGYPWTDNKQSFIFTETGVVDAQNKNVLVISDATLVNLSNGQTILDQLRDYFRQRYFQKVTVLPTTLKKNDIVLSSTLYSNQILAAIQRMETDLTKGFLSKLFLRGIVPVYVPPALSPTRRARSGIAISGADLTRNNLWRQYA